MQPDFDSAGKGDFIVTHALPPGYNGPVLRGSAVICAAGENGSAIFQQLRQQEFTLSFEQYHFPAPQTIMGNQEDRFLISLLALKNNIRYFIQGIGSLYLKPGQFALFHGDKRSVALSVEKETQTFEISLSAEIIQQSIPFFPFLKQFVESPLTPDSFFLGKAGIDAGFKTLGIIHELLHNPHDDEVTPLFYENKIRELLMNMLVDNRKKRARKQKLTGDEEEKIREIGEMITKQINNKFPILVLAKKAGMNEMKLKTAFKEIFGKAIFEYQLAARMEEAHRLIMETKMTTKAIATKVGYRHSCSFVTKFSEYFGYPPGRSSVDLLPIANIILPFANTFNLENACTASHLCILNSRIMKLLAIKKNFSLIASSLLILLFVYAATSKLLDYQKFRVELGQSPILTVIAGWIAWIIPAIEIGISIMLAYSRSRLTALYASFSLMTIFTAYIFAITRFSEYVPCSCGGILSNMNWTQHFYFNIVFIMIALGGILLYRQENEKDILLQ